MNDRPQSNRDKLFIWSSHAPIDFACNLGSAIANYDSVEHGDRIINAAIENFGKVDIVVNNAGILRDRSFLKMTDDDLNKVMSVHFQGDPILN